ncbi:hypothetical protein OFY17_09725 [Marinomonas sp. C2222]|uniref:Uncharacterized protein n=1 Tax=Marinomonas sargassi TaxID=2984494 RepID=A0ABT2YTD6_9GAMM|nr:hypothetical protein [Marinomonas sargassi]MCV2403155.1 hypothetical protein [Marinomonas sargassi]
MSKETQLFIGLRRENGQIGYLSESLSIPEFFDLVRPVSDGHSSLVDFSPVIEALHSNHEKHVEQSIREKYNSVFNYWQESKSYSNMQIKLPKFESLSLLSNELIISLQSRIEKSKSSHSHWRTGDLDENIKVIRGIEKDCNVYIDVLLCFIHSKASLEIESFKNDVVLGQYCDYLKDVISGLFNDVVGYSTWNDRFSLVDSSLLYQIAFKETDEISYYTKLLPSFDQSQDLRLSLLNKSSSEDFHYGQNERVTKIGIEYRAPGYQELEAAKILRNISYKINSISELLKRLKKGDVDWDPNESAVEELKELVSNDKTM